MIVKYNKLPRSNENFYILYFNDCYVFNQKINFIQFHHVNQKVCIFLLNFFGHIYPSINYAKELSE